MLENEKRIGIYIRVSTNEQVEGYSIPLQRRDTNAYLNLYPDKFSPLRNEYLDDGVSAKNLKRKSVQKMITDIQNGEIDKVVIYSLDRLTRSVKDWLFLFDIFSYHGVELISMRENIDTSTVQGRFFVMIIILVAEWERGEGSERTKTRMRQAMREGKWVFGHAPYGFNVVEKVLVRNEIESEIVKKIFHLYYFDEYSAYSISEYLSSLTDTTFSWDRVRKILSNRLYMGDYIKDDFEIIGYVQPLISEQLFINTQNALEFRNDYDSLDYLFRMKCFEQDGEQLVVDSSSKNNGEKVYLYYYSKNLNARINEKYVNEQIREIIDDFIQGEYQKLIKRENKKISKLEGALRTVSKMYRDGVIKKEHYRKVNKKLKAKMTNVEINSILKELEIQYWDSMENMEKMEFVKRYVDKIVIDVVGKRIVYVEFY